MPTVGERHPVDEVTFDLLELYGRSIANLETVIRDGLRRGLDETRLGTPGQQEGDATHAYRIRQREQAEAIVDQLGRQSRALSPIVVRNAYRSGIVAVDRTLGPGARAAGEFGRVHVRAVEAAAQNMTDSLNAAVAQTGRRVADLFDVADRLAGPLSPAGLRGFTDIPFLGRRLNDDYRRIAVETVGEGAIQLDTRRQVSAAIIRKLETEGVTDATTGFVDRAGRRWPLDTYARMVARTTTREATTRATVNRLTENGSDLVTVSSHNHPADECTPYEGNTYSLSGNDPTYPPLDELPPFHPNCVHVLLPAEATLDAFERELNDHAAKVAAATPAPPRR